MTLIDTGAQKRVAIVAPTLAGVLRNQFNLIRTLNARGHAVLVIAASHLSGEVAALHHLGGEHRTFDPKPPGLTLLANRRVVRAVRDMLTAWRADTVVVSGEELASLGATAARKAGAPNILTIFAAEIGSGSAEERTRLLPLLRRAIKLSKTVICHNASDAHAVASLLRPRAAELIVASGDGVDLEAFPAVPLPPADRPLSFLMIANPDARSAIEGYTTAAHVLLERGRAARFILATDREAAEDTTLLTVQGVAFAGRAIDPAALLSSAHVAVHLSADDGSPTALKQALATGRPVVTLDVPGCREAVDQRVNGCLVTPGDQPALVAALESFLTHRDLLPSESRAARAKAERVFGAQTVLAPVLAAIEQAGPR